jgi:hypothetical protein
MEQHGVTVRSPIGGTARLPVAERLSSTHIDWCLEHIRLHCSPDSEIVDVRGVPSRTAEVYRLVATAGHDRRTFYLKCYPASDSEAVLRARFEYLALVAGAFDRSGVISPTRVIGSDAQRGFLLTADTVGESLLAIHRSMSHRIGFGDQGRAVSAWRGVGTWLGTLHWRTVPPRQSATRAREVLDYTNERFRDWATLDRRRRQMAARAHETVAFLAGQAARQPVTITPCHGDVSTGNIIVASGVGLVDFDNMQPDMPAIDVSQALMELREFAFVGSVVPMRAFLKAAQAAFVTGYGHPLPEGPEFWLPHLRNLSVYVLTLASRCHGLSMYRLTEEVRYRRTIRELSRTIRVVWSCGPGAGYFQ